MTETIALGLLENIYLTVISSFPYYRMQVHQSDEQTRAVRVIMLKTAKDVRLKTTKDG